MFQKIMDNIATSYSVSQRTATQAYGGEDRRAQKNTPGNTDLSSEKTTSTTDAKQDLTPDEQAAISKLQQRDRVVRQHEAAHLAASGGLAVSGANFSMQTGPDGKRYAVGGEVRIDISAGRTPEETLRRARIIQAAALAPADPSSADQQIAAQAKNMELAAQMEIASRNRQEQKVASRYQPESLPVSTMASQA